MAACQDSEWTIAMSPDASPGATEILRLVLTINSGGVISGYMYYPTNTRFSTVTGTCQPLTRRMIVLIQRS